MTLILFILFVGLSFYIGGLIAEGFVEAVTTGRHNLPALVVPFVVWAVITLLLRALLR